MDFKKPYHQNSIQHQRRLFERVFAAAAGLLVALFFVLVYHGYSTSHLNLDKNPLVFNLKDSSLIETKISFGPQSICGNHPCFVSPAFNDELWQTIKIPDPLTFKLEQKETKGPFDMGMRIWITIPKILLESTHVISFAPLYIDGKHIMVFIGGNLVYEAEGSSVRESNTIITIPREYIQDGKVFLAISAILDRKINPILHRYKLYLGPKEEVEYLHRATMNFGVNYHMLATFSKGSVFIIFALIFLYTRSTPGFFFFLIYALGATVEHPIIGNNGLLTADIQVPTYFQVKAAMTGALLLYFCKYFNAKKLEKWCYILWAIFHPMMLSLSILSNSKIALIKIPTLLWISNGLYFGVFAFAIYQGRIYIKFLAENKVEKYLIKNTKQFIIIIALYAALVFYQTYFVIYQGDELRLFLDLIFFFYIALTNARNAGLNEGKIITLEGHYAEKIRMEQELNEAAVIARALLPASTPNWDFCRIDLFHKSITESSGDWYAFEVSSDSRLYHLILCDITGHGVQAAIIVSTCKTVLSNMKADLPNITNSSDFVLLFAQRLAATLYSHGDGHHTATFLGVTFEPSQGKIYYVNGGHPAPFLVEPSMDNTKIKQLVSRGNPLGFNPDAFDLTIKEASFGERQLLILNTDGIPLGTNLKAFRHFFSDHLKADKKISSEEDQSKKKINDKKDSAFEGDQKQIAESLYQKIWQAHEARTGHKPDDDVSIIIIHFLPKVINSLSYDKNQLSS